MTTEYKARPSAGEPLATFELESGRYKVRYPRIGDRRLLEDIGKRQHERRRAYLESLKAKADELKGKALAAAEEAGDDEAGRAVIEAYGEELEPPVEVSDDYEHAEVITAFMSPEIEPAVFLAALDESGYEIRALYECHALLVDEFTGEGPKKRVRGRS